MQVYHGDFMLHQAHPQLHTGTKLGLAPNTVKLGPSMNQQFKIAANGALQPQQFLAKNTVQNTSGKAPEASPMPTHQSFDRQKVNCLAL